LWIWAAEASSGDNSAIVYAVCGLLGTVATGIVAIVVAQINAKKNEDARAASPDHSSVESRVLVLEHRAEDADERHDVLDKEVDSALRWIYRQDPEWKP
jgi:hypothetical protein